MNPILAALLSSPGLAAPASPSLATPAAGTTDAQSSLLFKVQFNQALAAVTGTTNGSAATATPATDTLTADLQKKIADLLNQGVSLTDIVKQLAQSLATQFAQAFGGDASTIQANLQLAFGTALSPPGNGPPLSVADTASALAQRFRQVADLAARVSGETTGQSNRLFAARSSDAATTAGVQAAPQSQPTNGPGQLSADSILTGASSALASLTTALTPAPTLASGQPVQASTPGDGKTVVVNDAPPIGTNGDTVLGRILARATLAAQAAAAPVGAPAPLKAPEPGATTVATDVATAAATTATGTTRVQVDPSLNAFLRSFTSAIATSDAQPSSGGAKQLAWDDTTLQTLLGAPVTSSQAPTVAAFMPVQAPFTIDATNANAPQQPVLPQPYTTAVDTNGVVDQVLKGVFLSNDGTSSNVSLKLLPDSLGTVNVKLTVDGGNVSAQVVAQTSDARDALLAGQSQLTRSLADAGLKLTSFNVSLAGGSFGSFQQQQQQQASMQHKSFGRRLLLDGVDTNENADSALSAIPSFGPPLVANMNWAALNYLA